MGVGRIFSKEGPLADFSKIFLGEAKSGEICWFPLKTKKINFFVKIFKIQGALPPILPTPVVEVTTITRFMHQFSKRCNGLQKVHFCGKLVYSFTWKRFQNRCEWSACFHGAFSLWCRNSKAFCERPFPLQRQQPKNISNMMTLPTPLEKFMLSPMAVFTLSASFEASASQAAAYHVRNEN